MPRFDVTTFGEGQLRYSVAAGHRLEQADHFDLHAVGTEANVTGLLARLGWRAGWLSALPSNPLGRRVANQFRLAGLDLSAVIWCEGRRLATYYVEYAVPPRPTQVYFDRADTCFTNMTVADVDWAYLLDTRLIHLSGLTLPLSPSVREIILTAVMRARAAGVPISFDMNYRRRLWPPEEARATALRVFRDVDILFCSRGDARQIFGIEGTPEDIVRQLAELTTAAYIVTSLSSDGIIGWSRCDDILIHQPARPVVILDRIGAGDAMVGGVLHGWLQGDFAKGLRYGALTAALALSQYGDQVITNPQELESLLETTSSDIVR